jgi:hypothetical protein
MTYEDVIIMILFLIFNGGTLLIVNYYARKDRY